MLQIDNIGTRQRLLPLTMPPEILTDEHLGTIPLTNQEWEYRDRPQHKNVREMIHWPCHVWLITPTITGISFEWQYWQKHVEEKHNKLTAKKYTGHLIRLGEPQTQPPITTMSSMMFTSGTKKEKMKRQRKWETKTQGWQRGRPRNITIKTSKPSKTCVQSQKFRTRCIDTIKSQTLLDIATK